MTENPLKRIAEMPDKFEETVQEMREEGETDLRSVLWPLEEIREYVEMHLC